MSAVALRTFGSAATSCSNWARSAGVSSSRSAGIGSPAYGSAPTLRVCSSVSTARSLGVWSASPFWPAPCMTLPAANFVTHFSSSWKTSSFTISPRLPLRTSSSPACQTKNTG